MRNKLNFITKCTLLGVEILNNISADIDNSGKQFNCKYMSLYLDFKYSQCDVLHMHHNYGIMRINVAWRKVWKLPNLTHCNLLPVITIFYH